MPKTVLDNAPRNSRIAIANRIFFTTEPPQNWFCRENACFQEACLQVSQKFPCSEIGTKSVRMSALEDLLKRTLSSVAGWWGKFYYLAFTRNERGGYEHWGFARTHGDTAAQAAFSQAHTFVFSHVLRAPISDLIEDMELAARERNISTAEFIAQLRGQMRNSVPENLAGGSVKHFNSVLDAISLLCLTRRQNPTHRAA